MSTSAWDSHLKLVLTFTVVYLLGWSMVVESSLMKCPTSLCDFWKWSLVILSCWGGVVHAICAKLCWWLYFQETYCWCWKLTCTAMYFWCSRLLEFIVHVTFCVPVALQLRPREKEAFSYAEKLKEKYAHHPEVRRISRHRHVPKAIHSARKELRTIRTSQKKKYIKLVLYILLLF